MDAVVCQYCNTEVSMIEVEKEGGLCPECGAMMDGSQIWDADDDDDFDEEEDVEEELDDEDLDDFDDMDEEEDDDY